LTLGFLFFSRAIKKINRLTEVETTYFDQRNEYREIELALKASRKREIAWWAWPTWSISYFLLAFFTGLVS